MAETDSSGAVWADLVDIVDSCEGVPISGTQWSHESEDMDMTLLSWATGKRIEPHVNREVDVIWLGVKGTGTVTINGKSRELRPGVALLIPKGTERAVQSDSEQFSYLSLHPRRRGLRPTLGRNGPTL